MGRLVKILLVLVAGVVAIAAIASVALFLFFDPNDFREDISAGVKDATGRDLSIEGDLSLSVFPWIAVEVGRTSLGNADGFGDEPFLTFEQARLSVKLLPLLFKQEVEVGTASLDSLQVNLAVAKSGVSNWEDLSSTEESAPVDDSAGGRGADSAALDIANISISNASISYTDAQAGTSYAVSGLSMNTGRIAAGSPFDIDAEFNFDSSPDNIGGQLSVRGSVLLSEDNKQLSVDGLNISGNLRGIAPAPTDFNFDSRAISVDMATETMSLGELDLALLGLSMTAIVEPFSYAGNLQADANLRVHEFSLKDLARTMGEPAPQTIDPEALKRVSFSADAVVSETALSLNNMSLQLDDTSMQGELTLPTTEGGVIRFDLVADSINLDGYMAPSEESSSAGDGVEEEIEIPVDAIRALNASGTFVLQQASLSGLTFENLELGLNSGDGKLRLYPISAEFYEGSYKGDVQIDASGDTPSISVNENIVDVQLTPLVQAMYGVANVSGTINGRFVLSGRGVDMAAIRQDIDGNMVFELKDGTWEGTDIWYQLRRARAMLKQEAPPEPVLPERTEFSQVAASGTVNNGVFTSDNFIAELPFMRMTGSGTVNFAAGEVDYALEARIVDKPELMGGATAREIADFTAAVVPLKISGPLTSPRIGIDIEGMLRREVDRAVEKEVERIKDRLLESVFGSADSGEEATAEADAEAVEENPEGKKKKKSDRDKLKDALKDLIGC